jgi:hypothetical protein
LCIKIANVNQGILSACLILLLVSSTSLAEVYKWVDADGQTHYSEKKEDAGKAKAEALKFMSQPTTQATSSSPQFWQGQERQFKQRQVQILNEKPNAPPVVTRPESLSGGRSDETDSGRCNLARDVISGAVTHRNGAPTDKYDREVAENDIRAYCH